MTEADRVHSTPTLNTSAPEELQVPPRDHAESADSFSAQAAIGSGRRGATFMTKIEYLDRPPAGRFVLDVMRRERRAGDWSALMIDVDPRRSQESHLRIPSGAVRPSRRLRALPRKPTSSLMSGSHRR